MTAQAMVASAFTAPHVTEFVTVDVTRTMELVERLKQRPRLPRTCKVSPLLLVAKALLLAIKRNPDINAAWDEAAQEIVRQALREPRHRGGHPARPGRAEHQGRRPACRCASWPRRCSGLTATAREGRTQPADMAGGTITITNVGVFGVDAGTPILNPGESAILCFGAGPRHAVGASTASSRSRKVTQLALSFDHRLVDGELGSMFLADVARVLEDPATALLW